METIRELISVSFLSVSNVWFVMLYHFSIESPLTLGRTLSHTPTVVQRGGEVDRTPLEFDMLHYFETICLRWKPFDLLYKMRYIKFVYGWWLR